MEDNRKTLIKNIEDTATSEEKTIEEEISGAVDAPTIAEEEPTVAEEEPTVADDEATVAETAPTVADDEATATEDSPTVADEVTSRKTKVIEEKIEEKVEEAKTDEEPGEDAPKKEDQKEEAEKEYGLPADHPEMGELRERIAKRKKDKKKKQRRFRTWVYVTACALMLIVFGFFFSISGFFTVDSIEVEGNEHYTNEEIINISHAVPGRNLLYNTNKSEIIDYLEQNPYIKSAEVKRKLPSTILIVVNERSEKMAFKYDDDYLVMDEEGILLKKTRNLPQTTLVEGLIVSKIKLGEKIGTEDREKTNKAISLINSMSSADLYFVKLDVSNLKKVKAYIYDNLVVRADYDTLVTNINNGHLHQVVEKLFKDGIKRGTITFDEDGSASFMPVI